MKATLSIRILNDQRKKDAVIQKSQSGDADSTVATCLGPPETCFYPGYGKAFVLTAPWAKTKAFFFQG